jgi:hypothetical protein
VSNILGPYDQLDFITMQKLKCTLQDYKRRDVLKYKRAIDKYTAILKHYMSKVA